MKYELDYIEKLKDLSMYIDYNSAATTLRGYPHTRKAISIAIDNDIEMMKAFAEHSSVTKYPITY